MSFDFNFHQRKKVLIRGPILSRSGYGHHARFLIDSLQKFEDRFDIFAINVGWGATSWIHEDSDQRKWYDFIIQKTIHHIQNGGGFDISIQVTIPGEFERLAPINIGVTAGVETDRIPGEWIEKCNLMDKVITISEFSKNVIVDTVYQAENRQTGEINDNYRVTTPVEVVNYPAVIREPKQVDLELKTDFNFLLAAQWSARKNIEASIRWFVEEFHEDENVGLIVKTNVSKQSIPDRFACTERVLNLLEDYPDKKCSVYLLHGEFSEEELVGLYTHEKVKAMVTISHGEGWGLPLFDAAIYGLPIVAVGYSGYVDFLYWPEVKKRRKKGKVIEVQLERNQPLFTEVDYVIAPIQEEAVWGGILERGSRWAFAEESSYKKQLRFVTNNLSKLKKQAERLSDLVRDKYEADKQYLRFADAIWTPTAEEEKWESELNKVEIL